MSNPEEENKDPKDQETQIILKVKSQEGDEVLFRIKKSTQLKNIMYAYCDLRGVKLEAFAFMFDGRRIRREHTPDEVDMKDGNVIQWWSTSKSASMVLYGFR